MSLYAFLNAPGINAVTVIIAVIIAVIKELLKKKLKNGIIKAVFPFISGILLYTVYALIFLLSTNSFNFSTIIISGTACGTLSSSISFIIGKIKSGKTSFPANAKEVAVNLLLTDFGVSEEKALIVTEKLISVTASNSGNNIYNEIYTILSENINETTPENLTVLTLMIKSVLLPEQSNLNN